MAKVKTVFFCNECGYESQGWLGKCPACQAWNTFVEERVDNSNGDSSKILFNSPLRKDAKAVKIAEIKVENHKRIDSGISELDRVMGGGIVPGSLVLAAGDPGIGKSTLMLMISGHLAQNHKVLYVSGEESESQVKMRADRLLVSGDGLYVFSETDVGKIIGVIEEIKPEFIILDSIQTLSDSEIQSPPGSVSQVRDITATFMKIAKTNNITVFIVGHVTKEGAIAGPRVLEHMVDTVLYFEGEKHLAYRILRAVKNRFGSTDEIGVFEMTETGLSEVGNPSAKMLEGRPTDASGTAIVCSMEGTRPIMLEIQALVASSSLTNPRRMCTGVDFNRISMLLAVLEKRAGYKLGVCDAFVNVIGGIKLSEPATDLAICAAVMSSYRSVPLPDSIVFIGEVGLAGEVRSVNQITKRVSEAFRLGFKNIIVPMGNKSVLDKSNLSGNIIYVSNVLDIDRRFGNNG